MITVKLYGLLRIESGIRERQLEAGSVREVLGDLAGLGIPETSLRGCAIFINGAAGTKRSKLKDGDTVAFLPPVAGG